MADTPYLGEIKLFSFNFAPQGFAQCNGQFLPINNNQALFALFGTNYGGNGQTTFALPDLRGKVPIHKGNSFVIGQAGGQAVHTLTINEMPTHSHGAIASSNGPTVKTVAGNFWASNTGFNAYGTTLNTALSPTAVSNVGGSQAHNNMSPYLVLNMCVALQGVFPSQN